MTDESLDVAAIRLANSEHYRVLKLPPDSLSCAPAAPGETVRPGLAISVCAHSKAVAAVPFTYNDDGDIVEAPDLSAHFTPWDENAKNREAEVAKLQSFLSVSKLIVSDDAKLAHSVITSHAPDAATLPWACLSAMPWTDMEVYGSDLMGWAHSCGLFFRNFNPLDMARVVVGVLAVANLPSQISALNYLRSDLKTPWYRLVVKHPADGPGAVALRMLGMESVAHAGEHAFGIAMPKALVDQRGVGYLAKVEELGLVGEWVSVAPSERYR